MPKDKTEKRKSELKMAREGKVGKLSIVGPIGWSWFGMNYPTFKQQLDDLGDVNTLEVDITSPGGIVTDGIAITNALINHDSTVHIYINGIAASVASVIAMAGDRIFIPSNSTLMVHKPLISYMSGNADKLRKNAEALDKLEKGMVATYMRHFSGSEKELQTLMRNETYLTADEMESKFKNVTVMKQEIQAVAFEGDFDELGEIEASSDDRSLLERIKSLVTKQPVVNKAENQPQEEDMPITAEEQKQMADAAAATVVQVLAEKGFLPEKEEAAPATPKAEVKFEGDPSDQEAIKAHIEALKHAQLLAAVDWSSVESVASYQKAVFGPQSEAPAPTNTESPVGVRGKAVVGAITPDQIKAKVEELKALRGGK